LADDIRPTLARASCYSKPNEPLIAADPLLVQRYFMCHIELASLCFFD